MEKQWVEGQGLMVKDSDVSIENRGNSSALNAGLVVLLKQWDTEADRLMKTAKRCENPLEKAAYRGTALKIRTMMQEVIDVIKENY